VAAPTEVRGQQQMRPVIPELHTVLKDIMQGLTIENVRSSLKAPSISTNFDSGIFIIHIISHAEENVDKDTTGLPAWIWDPNRNFDYWESLYKAYKYPFEMKISKGDLVKEKSPLPVINTFKCLETATWSAKEERWTRQYNGSTC
jgi:hypothetical protein